jgi:arylsulfatase
VGFDDDRWELYHVDEDPSECHDVAEQRPAKLRELIDRWWTEAGRNQVLPLDNRPFSELVFQRPAAVPERSRYICRPGAAAVPEVVAVNVRNRSHVITAEVEMPASGADGVLVAQGSGLGGWSFYVAGRRLAYVHNFVSLEEHHVRSDVELSAGRHELRFQFARTADHQGRGRLLVDGEVVGEGAIPRFTPTRFSLTGAGLTCGYGDGLAVTREYRPPFRFTGRIIRAVIDVDGAAFVDPEGEASAAIASQ